MSGQYPFSTLITDRTCTSFIALQLMNGKEFSYHEQIRKALDTAFYFAHPYSSWEHGVNENTIGLIRQYFSKKIDFKTVTD